MLYAAVVLATVTLALILFQFIEILILFILALLVSAAIQPAVSFLVTRFKIPRVYATIGVYISGIVTLLLFIIVPGNALIDEFQTLFNDIAATYETRYPAWVEGSTLEQAIAAELPPPDQLYETLADPIFGQEIMGLTRGLFGLLSGAAVALVLSIYWTIDQARLERYWLSILPTTRRVQARKIWRATETGVGAYFRSETIQSVAAALILMVVYSLIGIDFPFILAGLAAIAWLIPLLGVVFAVLPVLGVGLLHNEVGLSLVAALCTIAILSGLEMVVEPRLFNRRRYNPTTTVLLMMVFVQDFGLVGLILAPPITAALQIIFNNTLEILTGSPAKPKKPAQEVNLLRDRLAGLIKAQRENGNEVSAELTNLTTRLTNLLDEANRL
jgi:predicted PurR-regulated permease PerM